MQFTLLTITSLLTAVQAAAEPAAMPAPYYKMGSMSLNTAFGLGRRQAGYNPTQTFCTSGATCAEACGVGYITCPSTDGEGHCYDPTGLKETCCPDGSGNSCSDGYFCTSDSTGGTWCCPNGMDLKACAAAYSLTGVLVSQTAAPTVSTTPSSKPASTTASTSTYLSASSVPTSPASSKGAGTGTGSKTKTTSAAVTSTTSISNTTVASTTSSIPVQVTGGANSNAKVGAGLMVLMGALAAL